jgi:hypothetical protein
LMRKGTLGAAMAHVQRAGAAQRYVFHCGLHLGEMALVHPDGTFPQLLTLFHSNETGTWKKLFVDREASLCTVDCANYGHICPVERPPRGTIVHGLWRASMAMMPAMHGNPSVKRAVNYLCTLRLSRAPVGHSLRWTWEDLIPRPGPGMSIRGWCAPREDAGACGIMGNYDRILGAMRGECQDVAALMPYSC